MDRRRLAQRLLQPTGLLRPISGDVSRLDLLRRANAERLARTASSVHDYLEYVGLEHLPPHGREPRWGHGKPVHPLLERTIASYADTYRAVLNDVVALTSELATLPVDAPNDVEPCWRNTWLPGLDTAVLYTMLRRQRPERYVEVGSGFSTRVAARAIRDGQLATRLISIDPQPRASVDPLCDTLIRTPAEEVGLETWAQLQSGDVLFVDNSHRVLMHSDATVFFLEVLPTLPEGVVVGLHDILLPADYFPTWGEYLFSEQYLLAAYLLAESPWVRPLFAAYWAHELAGLTAPLEPLWDRVGRELVDRRGWSFWFTVGRTSAPAPPSSR